MAQNRPYILIPFVTAETLLRITISEVTDWPKAKVCGQIEMPIFHNLLWRRASSHVHDFSNQVGWHDLPTHGDGSVLTLMLPKEPQVKQFGSSSRDNNNNKGNASTRLPNLPSSGTSSPRKSPVKSPGRKGG